MKRICFVTHCYPTSEDDLVGSWAPLVADMIMEAGHEVYFVTPQMGNLPIQWVGHPKKRIVWFHWRGGERRLATLRMTRPGDVWALWDLIREGRQALHHVIHRERIEYCMGLHCVPGGYFCYDAFRALGVPYSVWCLGSDLNVYGRKRALRPVIRAILRSADHLFANSFGLQQRIRELVNRESTYIFAARDLPPASDQPIPLHGNGIRFLFVGRLEPVKGPDILLEAFAILTASTPDAHVYLLGDGFQKEALQNQARALKLDDRVHLVGRVDPPVVRAYLEQCDYLVIPSRSEGMPLIFFEAIDAKVPIVSTDVGDIRHYIEHYELGVVVPPENPGALAGAMRQIQDIDRDEFVRQSQSLKRQFSLKRSAEVLIDLFSDRHVSEKGHGDSP